MHHKSALRGHRSDRGIDSKFLLPSIPDTTNTGPTHIRHEGEEPIGNQRLAVTSISRFAGGKGTGETDPASSIVRIKTKAGSASAQMEPQTVAEALAALKRDPDFGEGNLQSPNGVILANDSRLRGGNDYVFVPATAAGKHRG